MAESPSLMDLDEFVRSAIEQIVRGVHAAAAVASDIDPSARVNPRNAGLRYSNVTEIAFDVAVTVSGKSEAEGGAKVKVWGLVNVGGKGHHADEHETVSRVRFQVPVALPSTPGNQVTSTPAVLTGR